MLTLVAAVLAYDMAREMCDARSSTVETEGAARGRRGPFPSRIERSCTRLEKDMMKAQSLSVYGSARVLLDVYVSYVEAGGGRKTAVDSGTFGRWTSGSRQTSCCCGAVADFKFRQEEGKA
jgi:hypothetical protein